MRCELISWDQVQGLVRRLALSIRESGFQLEMLLAIGWGGYVQGNIVSQESASLERLS